MYLQNTLFNDPFFLNEDYNTPVLIYNELRKLGIVSDSY